MIRKLIGLVLIAYVLGFGVFMLRLARPLQGQTSDAVVVLTGGAGRIDRGIALLEAKAARRMLVSGVAIGVTPADLAREYHAPRRIFSCCIDLGNEAVDTRSNAEETAAWVREHGYKSIRLVTSDWHMPRAKLELANALGHDVTILPDGVPSPRRLPMLIAEYNKLLLRRVALWIGAGA